MKRRGGAEIVEAPERDRAVGLQFVNAFSSHTCPAPMLHDDPATEGVASCSNVL
jgi:hypothetical protein